MGLEPAAISPHVGNATRAPGDRLALLALLGIAVVMFLPALRSGFIIDDYLHASMADGSFPVHRSPLDLYDWIGDGDRAVLMDRGLFPWWSHPQLTFRFFRPLASVVLWLEHRVFHRHPGPMHAVSLLWWAIAVLAVRRLFRQSFTPRVTWIATIVFALAPCHAIPIAWLANSEALLALAFGTFGLTAYVQWREEHGASDAVLAALLFALANACGEYALAFGGYIVAIEAMRRNDRWVRRAVGLLPFAIPAAAYLIVRSRLHYGTVGSGFYTDPLHEPRAFLAVVPWRLTALLSNLWLTLDAETASSQLSRIGYGIVVATVAALSVVPLRRAIGALPEASRRTATWMLSGSAIALVPTLAVAPSARLVGVSTIGIAAVVAILLDHAWFPEGTPARDRSTEITGLVAVLLGFAHLVHGPANAWLTGERFRRTSVEFATAIADLRPRLPDPASSTVTVVRAGGASFIAPFAIDPTGRPPARWRVLALAGHVLVVRRDARTLELFTSREQGMFRPDRSDLFRSGQSRVAAGFTTHAAGMRVTVLQANEHGPSHVLYEFDRDLDDPSLVWLAEDHNGFQTIELPEPGFGRPFDP